jgi:hypothetical protein
MSLNKVLEEIKKVKPLVDEDISVGPRETYAGREGRQRNAKERLKGLKEQYVDELRTSAAFILVSGTQKDKFSDLATLEFKCFSADPEGFYKELANRLPEELYKNKTPAATLFDIMGRHLEDKASEMQIVGYPQLIMKQQYQRALSDKKDFVALVKQAINEQVGSEIAGIHAVRSIVDFAISSDHGSKITPIVMVTDDESLALDLYQTLGRIGSRAFLVVAGKEAKTIKSKEGVFVVKEVTKENVENALTNIKSLCKNK